MFLPSNFVRRLYCVVPFESDSLPVHVLLRFSHAILQSNSLPYAFFTISHQIPPDRPLPNCSTFSFPSTDHAMSQISLGPCHIPYQFYILSFFNEDFTSYLNNMIFFHITNFFSSDRSTRIVFEADFNQKWRTVYSINMNQIE